MTIKKFISKAIEGGWVDKRYRNESKKMIKYWKDRMKSGAMFVDINEAVLDPKFWQAVGKVEGWKALKDFHHPTVGKLYYRYPDDDEFLGFDGPEWYEKMHSMIDALAEGKSIEEFVKTL